MFRPAPRRVRRIMRPSPRKSAMYHFSPNSGGSTHLLASQKLLHATFRRRDGPGSARSSRKIAGAGGEGEEEGQRRRGGAPRWSIKFHRPIGGSQSLQMHAPRRNSKFWAPKQPREEAASVARSFRPVNWAELRHGRTTYLFPRMHARLLIPFSTVMISGENCVTQISGENCVTGPIFVTGQIFEQI